MYLNGRTNILGHIGQVLIVRSRHVLCRHMQLERTMIVIGYSLPTMLDDFIAQKFMIFRHVHQGRYEQPTFVIVESYYE